MYQGDLEAEMLAVMQEIAEFMLWNRPKNKTNNYTKNLLGNSEEQVSQKVQGTALSLPTDAQQGIPLP